MSKLYERAAEAVKKRNYDYAIELFLRELTLEPNNVDARKALRAAELKKYQELGELPTGIGPYLKGLGSLVMAAIHMITKNWEKLMLDCEQLLKRAPRNARFLGMLGDASRAAGHIDAAIVAFEELREADHANPRAHRCLAQLYREKGDLARALLYYEQLKRILPSDPEAAKAVRDLAAAGATRKVEEAKEAGGEGTFRDLIKDKKEAERLEQQQHRVRTESDAEAAIKRMEAELQRSPNDPKLLKQIGDLCLKKRDYERAASYYERALAVRPDTQISEALGDLRIRKFDEEIAALTEAAKKGEGDAKSRLRELKDARNEFCIEEYARRVKSHPTEVGLRFQLGQFLYKADRYDDAIAELQKSVVDPRRGSQARLLLGKCFAAKGMLDLAIKEFERARQGSTSMDDTTKEVTYNLAVTLEKAGHREKAVAEFEKIIEVDYNYKDARKRMEALKAPS